MSRILEISLQLGKLYSGMRVLEVAIGHKRDDLAARKLYLTPSAGWDGKNEEQRRVAAEKCFADDDICKQLNILLRDNESQLAELTYQVQTLEAERRGLEWGVRKDLVDVLRARRIDRQNVGPVEDTAFDDTLQHEADNALVDEVQVEAGQTPEPDADLLGEYDGQPPVPPMPEEPVLEDDFPF